MHKFFDKLPYDTLKDIKFVYLIAAAVGIGFVVIAAYYFTLYAASNNELDEHINKKKNIEQTLEDHKATIKNGAMVEYNSIKKEGTVTLSLKILFFLKQM